MRKLFSFIIALIDVISVLIGAITVIHWFGIDSKLKPRVVPVLTKLTAMVKKFKAA